MSMELRDQESKEQNKTVNINNKIDSKIERFVQTNTYI